MNIDKAGEGILDALCFEGGFERLEFGRDLSHECANEVELNELGYRFFTSTLQKDDYLLRDCLHNQLLK